MQGDHRGVHPSLERHLEFTAAAHVHAQAFLVDPAQHTPAAERLRGIEHPRVLAESLPELAAALPEILFVADEKRGAELGREVPHVPAADGPAWWIAVSPVAVPAARALRPLLAHGP